MSHQTRFLLDKVTTRHVLVGLLKLAEARDLATAEITALALYERAGAHGLRQFMVPSTDSVLRRLEARPRYAAIIRLFRQRVAVAVPARYCKRWARRLQEYGFTSEDAGVLALATFGTDQGSGILGMHAVVTFDQAMVTQWAAQRTAIATRLEAMQHDLQAPYCQVGLPRVLLPVTAYKDFDLSSPL